MKYTRNERRGIARVFRAAKKNLWDGEGSIAKAQINPYICYAITVTGLKHWRAALEVVNMRLEGYITLNSWLIRVKKIPSEDITPERIQVHRQAWLDKLIEEFES